jgi:hypothetical protein
MMAASPLVAMPGVGNRRYSMASAAAAMTARARREIQHQFFAADAVRPDRAIAFEPANHFERRQFERLRNRDIVREEGPGRYWLDLPAYDDLLQERHRRVRGAMIVLLLLLVAWMAFFGMTALR